MSIKKIIAVIFLALLTGIVIFLASNFFTNQKITTPNTQSLPFLTKSSPTPTPTATPIPINSSTDLKSEIKTLIPNDYNEEINKLKQ